MRGRWARQSNIWRRGKVFPKRVEREVEDLGEDKPYILPTVRPCIWILENIDIDKAILENMNNIQYILIREFLKILKMIKGFGKI